jgi:hypothetical protein
MAARKKVVEEPQQIEQTEPMTEIVEKVPIEKWPTRTMAARMLGVAIVTIDRMQARGELIAERDEKGVWRFDPDIIHEISSAKVQNDALGAAAIIEASQGLVSQAQEHNEALMKHATGSGHTMLELFGKQLQAAYDEIDKLRAKNFAMLEAHERIMSQQHERDLQSKVLEHDQSRKDQAWQLLMQITPGLLVKLMENIGKGKEVKTIVDAIVELPEEYIAVFESTGILKPEQMEAIKGLRKAHPKPAEPEPATEAGAA